MTTTAKVVLGIIIVILIALGAYYFSQQGPSGTMNGSPATQNAVQGGNAQTATNSSDASDAALVKDSAAIDAQINGFASDNSTVDSGLNDKPVAP